MLESLVNRSTPLPKGSKLLVLGGGFSGQHIAALARALGNEAVCSRRQINSQGADVIFDSVNKTIPTNLKLEKFTHLLSSIPPDADGKDPVLSCLEEQLKDMSLKWVGYLSTTGVYGDSKGKWVSEQDSPKPIQLRSKRRLSCEEAWQQTGLPIQILRLPGIYGPGRSAITSICKGNVRMVDKPGQVFSRIHVDDIAGATMHLISLAEKGQKPLIVNIADNVPASNIDVLRFAGKLLDKSLPPLEPFEIAKSKMNPMALSFWQENRRIKNRLLCEELGYQLLHPDYKSGLKDCFKEDLNLKK
ncbi:SDR family oxidoreductase [Prochlorococcus sp. MIT 1300]|uniref:SDR family oxidoreductase n=1 Tax=Prochlorococcus sp. MIT 1300 TaxID=3096218 RepID=UPI002A7633E7|nr:SDR family oxidoreductase [Prochlorococcus sp. MIT 1300]